VEELAGQFRREHMPRLGVRTQKEYGDLLDREIIPRLGTFKARDLDRPAVAKWHQGMRDTPRQANHALAVLSKMMSLAEIWGHRPQGANPCKGVPRFPENKRQHYLSPEELARVAAAVPETPAGNAIRLLILTGLRMGEVLALTWPMVDLAAGQVTLPASAHKGGRKKGAKTVLLPAAAVALLEGLPRSVRGQVVLATLGQIEHAWLLVRKQAEVPDVRPHDLRHTFVSWGAAQGLSLPTLGALVGHSEAATTQRYAHLSQSPLRAAVEQIGAALAAAMARVPSGA
jgi:integrase